jgi:hypothetical protein
MDSTRKETSFAWFKCFKKVGACLSCNIKTEHHVSTEMGYYNSVKYQIKAISK